MTLFVGPTAVGWLGWELGTFFTDDFGWLFFLSSVGTIAGVFVGWWAAQKMGLG